MDQAEYLRMLADSKDATQHGGASATGLELYIAARDGKKEVVKRLLQANAPLEHKGNYSWTPLSTACLNGHEEIVKLLLDAGANKEAQSNSGGTPLFLAAADGNEAVVKLLLEAGANKDAMDKFGETALVMATNEGHDAVVALLKPPAADEDEFSSPASKRMKTEKEAKPPDEWSLNLLKQIMEEAGVKKSGTKKELLGRLRDVVAAW